MFNGCFFFENGAVGQKINSEWKSVKLRCISKRNGLSS